MELIKKLYDRLSITNKTKTRHLIIRISDDKKLDDKKLDNKKLDGKKLNSKKVDSKKVDNKKVDSKKLERVDIIFDYSLLTIKC
jgi:hypothetical protein